MSVTAVLNKYYSGRISLKELNDAFEKMSKSELQAAGLIIRARLTQSIRNGSLSKRVYERAKPELDRIRDMESRAPNGMRRC